MSRSAVVTLFDVDNTLLDNDRIVADMRRHLGRTVGDEQQKRYWELFEQLRQELGYADYLGALQRFRVEDPHRPHLLAVSMFLLGYAFANRLFPGSLDAIEHARSSTRSPTPTRTSTRSWMRSATSSRSSTLCARSSITRARSHES